MSRFTGLLVVAIVLTAGIANAATILIDPATSNGSFESPGDMGYQLANPTDTYVNPWTMTSQPGTISQFTYHEAAFWNASQGTKSMYVATHNGTAAYTTLFSTSVNLAAGVNQVDLAALDYQLGGSATGAKFEMFLGGQSLGSVTSNSGPYKTLSATNVAYTGPTGIQNFEIHYSQGSDESGQCYLDNVRLTVSTVPEPSATAILIGGLAGLLCYAWRKRK